MTTCTRTLYTYICVYLCQQNSFAIFIFKGILFHISSEVLTRATTILTEALVTVKREIDDFCEQYDWLGKLYIFLMTWEVTQKTGYVSQDMKPKDIEVIG